MWRARFEPQVGKICRNAPPIDAEPARAVAAPVAGFGARDVAGPVAVSRESMTFKRGQSGNPSLVLALISHLTFEQKFRCSFSRRRAVQIF